MEFLLKQQHIMFLKIFFPAFAVVALLYFGINHLLSAEKKPSTRKVKPPRYSHFHPRAQQTSAVLAASRKQAGSYFTTAAEAAPANKKINTPLPHFNFAGSKTLPRNLSNMLTRSSCGILVDLNSRQVLWHHNSKKAVPVASLTKMMTALMLMEKMQLDRTFNMETPVTITNAATNVERSGVLGAVKGEVYTVEELMSAMLINSHNDAASQLADAAAGSVRTFVDAMNFRAKELDLVHQKFNSPNGLPQGRERSNSLSCSYDIVRICEYMMRYPEVMKLCGTAYKTLSNGKRLRSSNNLLRRRPVPGLIGFKTGFTNAAGFCLAFGVTRNGRTLLGCVTGFDKNGRDRFCRQLIEWGFKQN